MQRKCRGPAALLFAGKPQAAVAASGAARIAAAAAAPGAAAGRCGAQHALRRPDPDMRIVHLSDTHLGHAEYRRYDPVQQINQREADIYRAFGEIVDHILDTRPDLVIHAGDLFDSIRPSNRAISEAFRQLHRLSEARIPTVIVAGNHSTPRERSAGTVFELLQYIPFMHPVYGGKYEKIPIGDTAVHALPHTYSDDDLRDSVKMLTPDPAFKYNVMVAHAAIRGSGEASWGEFKEQVIPPGALNPGFDYIALGHYHKFLPMGSNAYYSGSPERLSFREMPDKKGFLEVELGRLPPRHVPTRAREMLKVGPIECNGATAAEVLERLERAMPADPSGKIVRAVFDGIEGHVHASLDQRRIAEIVSECAHYEPLYNWKLDRAQGAATGAARIGALADEFKAFMRRSGLKGVALKEATADGIVYLGKAQKEAD